MAVMMAATVAGPASASTIAPAKTMAPKLIFTPALLKLHVMVGKTITSTVSVSTDYTGTLANVTFAVSGAKNFPLTIAPSSITITKGTTATLVLTLGMKAKTPKAGDLMVKGMMGKKALGGDLKIEVNKTKAAPTAPKITWDPKSLTLKVAPGATASAIVTVTSSANLTATLGIMSSKDLTITVTGFPTELLAHTPVALTVHVTVAPKAAAKVLDGKLTVMVGKKAIGKPLDIKVTGK